VTNVRKQQKISYDEWLPAVFGSQAHLLNDIHLKGTGARITSEFAMAAYRWHTMVRVYFPSPPSLLFNFICLLLGSKPSRTMAIGAIVF
jgi:hypothetical protein